MADIQFRFGKDMLVIGSPVQTQLAVAATWSDGGCEGGNGEDDLMLAAEGGSSSASDGLEKLAGVTVVPVADETAFDVELALLLEPEVFEDPYRLEKLAGAQCLVAPTAGLTPARLAHTGMRDAAPELARTAVEVAEALSPEHVLVEIAPCGLPLDGASKASLMENRKQYERAARLFEGLSFDAFFLNGFTRTTDLKCALMGLRKVSDAPILASVDVDADGMLRPIAPELHPQPVRETLEEAIAVMAEHGAQVAGFCTDAGAEAAIVLAARVAAAARMPILAQLFLKNVEAEARGTDDAGSEDAAAWPHPEAIYDAGLDLAAAGVQFVRVTGAATPACTGALAAAVAGSDVMGDARSDARQSAGGAPSEGTMCTGADMDALARHLRTSVNDALGIGGA